MLHCHLEVRDWRIKVMKRIGLKIMYVDFYLWLNKVHISEGISTCCSLLASRPWSLHNVVVWILFLCGKTGPLLSMVLVGMCQVTSILMPRIVCILVAKNQPRAVNENFATCFSGEWNPIYSSLKMWIVKTLALFLLRSLQNLSPSPPKFHYTF